MLLLFLLTFLLRLLLVLGTLLLLVCDCNTSNLFYYLFGVGSGMGSPLVKACDEFFCLLGLRATCIYS